MSIQLPVLGEQATEREPSPTPRGREQPPFSPPPAKLAARLEALHSEDKQAQKVLQGGRRRQSSEASTPGRRRLVRHGARQPQEHGSRWTQARLPSRLPTRSVSPEHFALGRSLCSRAGGSWQKPDTLVSCVHIISAELRGSHMGEGRFGLEMQYNLGSFVCHAPPPPPPPPSAGPTAHPWPLHCPRSSAAHVGTSAARCPGRSQVCWG